MTCQINDNKNMTCQINDTKNMTCQINDNKNMTCQIKDFKILDYARTDYWLALKEGFTLNSCSQH